MPIIQLNRYLAMAGCVALLAGLSGCATWQQPVAESTQQKGEVATRPATQPFPIYVYPHYSPFGPPFGSVFYPPWYAPWPWYSSWYSPGYAPEHRSYPRYPIHNHRAPAARVAPVR